MATSRRKPPRKKFPHGYADVMATAILAYNKTLANAEIAEILGCHPRTLAPSNCPKLHEMRALIAIEQRGIYRGDSDD